MSLNLLLDVRPLPFGWHDRATFLECPRKFFYEYRSGAAREAVPARVRDLMVHAGVAHHYVRKQRVQQGKDPDQYATPEEAVRSYARLHGDMGEAELEGVLCAVQEYAQEYREEPWEVIAVAEVGEVEINGRTYRDRVDLAYRDAQNQVWFMDTRSSRRLSRSKASYLSMSGQMHGYRHIGHALFGDAFAGVRLNFVSPGRSPGFLRMDLPPASGASRSFGSTLKYADDGIAKCDAEAASKGASPHAWPPVGLPSICWSRPGPCPHLEKCQWD